MARTVPLTYLRHQAPNILGMVGAGVRSALPMRGDSEVETPSAPVTRCLGPVPEDLIAAYADWTGAPPDRYSDHLPPHMFCYWALGLISELTGQAPYNLLSAVNQGCRMVTERNLPASEAIEVRGQLADVSDDGRRIRIATHLDAGTQSAPDAQHIDVMAAVPRRNPKGGKRQSEQGAESDFETVGRWSAQAEDGINFALLTGDFNPLHTLPPLGRRTRYGGCILHGFGQLTRTYEAILNAGIGIGVFDIRYVKPVPLPTDSLDVQVARDRDDGGTRALRVQSPDGTLHLAGHLQETAEGAR